MIGYRIIARYEGALVTHQSGNRQQSFAEAIWSSVFWGSLDKLTALAKHIYVASAIGLSADLDVFYMANAILTLFVTSWSRIADVIAVPELISLRKRGQTKSALNLTGDLFTLSCLFSLALGTLLTLFWPWITHVAWGFDSQRQELLEQSVFWAEPLILLTIPVSMLYSFAKARRAFYLRYRNEFITSVTILACVILYPSSKGVLLWSFSLGMIFSFILAFVESRNTVNFLGNPISFPVRALLPMAPALLIFFAVEYLYALVDRQFVSFLPVGSISAIAYAWTLAKLLPSLLRIEGSFMTFYAESRDDREQQSNQLNSLVSTVIMTGVCLSLIIWEFAEPFISLALEHGKFNKTNTELVARCTRNFGIAMIPFLLTPSFGQICQVENRMILLVRRTLFGLFLNVFFCSIFLFLFELGAEGVSLATAISYWGMLLLSASLVRRFKIGIKYKHHAAWLITTLTYGALALLTVRLLKNMALGPWQPLIQLGIFFIIYFCPILLGKGSDSSLARAMLLSALRKLRLVSE